MNLVYVANKSNDIAYAWSYTKDKGDKLVCKEGHDMVYCCGQKKGKYFRHKNKGQESIACVMS